MRSRTYHRLLVSLLIAGVSTASHAQVRLTFSDQLSLGEAHGACRAYNFNQGANGVFDLQDELTLEPNVLIGDMVYDRAVVVTSTADDDNRGVPSVTRTSAAAFIGARRRGDRTYQIDFRAVTLSDTFNAGPFFGDAAVVAIAHLAFEVDRDGARTEDLRAVADWNYEARAETSCETYQPPMHEDSGRVEGVMNLNAALLEAPGFEIVRSSLPFGPPPFGQESGRIEAGIVDLGGQSFVFVNVTAIASSNFSAPGVGAFDEDLVGSEFIGSMTLTIEDLRGGPSCVADIDDGGGTGTPDGGVTIDDLLHYLLIFEQGRLAADVDDGSGSGTPDGGVTIDDLLYFLARFEAGC